VCGYTGHYAGRGDGAQVPPGVYPLPYIGLTRDWDLRDRKARLVACLMP
jgi:hypothetical protein